MPKPTWYSIRALAQPGSDAPTPHTIAIHDEIGAWGVSARDFLADFARIPEDAPITLSINSYGGEVFDALAIYHTLARSSARVTARVEGVAASAASLILMAAGRIEMPSNAYLMIHNPLGFAGGDADALRDYADTLDKLQASLASIYAARTGKTPDEVIALMDAETWYTGAQAVTEGFADAVDTPMAVAACLSERARARFAAHLPQALAAPEPQPEPAPEPEPAPQPEPEPDPEPAAAADTIAQACADAGFAHLAAPLIRAQATPAQLAARIAEAREITALAQAAGRGADAPALIDAGVAVEAARAQLMAARNAAAGPAITAVAGLDNRSAHDAQAAADAAKTLARLNPKNLYAARRAVQQTAH